MATIEKRTAGDGSLSYRVKVRIKGFTSESATFDRLTDAREWGRKTEADMKAGRHFGHSKLHTFNELADEYVKSAAGLRSVEDVKRAVGHWRKVFGKDLLATITASRIANERDRMLAAKTVRFATPPTGDPKVDAKRERAGRSGATVNRYLAALSA